MSANPDNLVHVLCADCGENILVEADPECPPDLRARLLRAMHLLCPKCKAIREEQWKLWRENNKQRWIEWKRKQEQKQA